MTVARISQRTSAQVPCERLLRADVAELGGHFAVYLADPWLGCGAPGPRTTWPPPGPASPPCPGQCSGGALSRAASPGGVLQAGDPRVPLSGIRHHWLPHSILLARAQPWRPVLEPFTTMAAVAIIWPDPHGGLAPPPPGGPSAPGPAPGSRLPPGPFPTQVAQAPRGGGWCPGPCPPQREPGAGRRAVLTRQGVPGASGPAPAVGLWCVGPAATALTAVCSRGVHQDLEAAVLPPQE